MSIETTSGAVPAAALAPVAVLPEHQRRGIAGRLIRHGLHLLRGQGERIVIVLGDPGYYPRFGFSRQTARSLEVLSPPMPSWRWNFAPVLSMVFAAGSDIRPRLDSESVPVHECGGGAIALGGGTPSTVFGSISSVRVPSGS